MVCEGLRLKTSEISCLIRVITGAGSETIKLGVHCVVIKFSFKSKICVATALIGFYSAVNDLRSVKHLLCQVHVKDLMLWRAMVSVYCKNGLFFDAIHTFAEMQDFGVCPNSVTLLSVLLAYANTTFNIGRNIHARLTRTVYSSSALIDFYSRLANCPREMPCSIDSRRKTKILYLGA